MGCDDCRVPCVALVVPADYLSVEAPSIRIRVQSGREARAQRERTASHTLGVLRRLSQARDFDTRLLSSPLTCSLPLDFMCPMAYRIHTKLLWDRTEPLDARSRAFRGGQGPHVVMGIPKHSSLVQL